MSILYIRWRYIGEDFCGIVGSVATGHLLRRLSFATVIYYNGYLLQRSSTATVGHQMRRSSRFHVKEQLNKETCTRRPGGDF